MVTLVSPHGAEGAAVLMLSGEGLDSASVTGTGSTEAYGRADSTSLRVLLVNQAGGALSFELGLPDVRRLPEWVVEEVAGPDDALRGPLAGYTVEFKR